MHIESLIRMANQIGAFFEAMPDRAEAVDGVAQHLVRFWEPRMRRQLLSHVDDSGDALLKRIVAEAIARHRSTLG
jgi:formate dehydrogenase subunit delta